MRFPTSWSWVKLQEGILEGVVKLHDGSLVSTAVAVVGGGEDGDHVPVVRPVVPLHHQLVGPRHMFRSKFMDTVSFDFHNIPRDECEAI